MLPINPNPYGLFDEWLFEVRESSQAMPEAMTLATAGEDGAVNARIVLLRGHDQHGFVFYTNYDSQKGIEIAANSRVSLVFYWQATGKQIRVQGTAVRTSADESNRYWRTRPRSSQIAARASRQSQVLASSAALTTAVRRLERDYAGKEVPRPANWGGYRVIPAVIEFWISQEFRLHERVRYVATASGWQTGRLYP